MSFIVTPSAGSTPTPPGGSDTQIQYNNAGSFGGAANFGIVGDNVVALATSSSVTGRSNIAASILTVKGGSSNIANAAGRLDLLGGDSSAAGAGGATNIRAGNATGSGNGGILSLNGGNSSSARGERINITGGNGPSNGGHVIARGGNCTLSGFAGDIQLYGGTNSDPASPGGGVYAFLGNNSVSGISGSFVIFTPAFNALFQAATFSGSDAIGFFNTLQAQVSTSVASATFVANAGSAVQDVSTFDGYTIAQAIRALRLYGLLQ